MSGIAFDHAIHAAMAGDIAINPVNLEVGRRSVPLLLVAALFLAPGCAFNLADVRYTPSAPLLVDSSGTTFTLSADAHIDRAPCNYDRVLRAGTRWESVGTLPEGRVFRSRDQSLTLECSNVFEAYPVVEQARIVAFYLPVEKALVKLPVPVNLSVQPATEE